MERAAYQRLTHKEIAVCFETSAHSGFGLL